MEFTDYKCPVCGRQFVQGDDVVVCPECGTPHHRECYENTGHCYFEQKHGDDFSYEAEAKADEKASEADDNKATKTCPNCKAENPKESFYCEQCGYPLNERDRQNANQNQQYGQNGQNPDFQNQNMPPFGMPYGQGQQQFGFAFDPMAGFKSDEPIGENVTAGEMSKFVGKNTPYYLRVFGGIKRFNKSRFNFSAFVFSGAHFLYRKMYGLGLLFAAITLALTVGETLIQLTPTYETLYSQLTTFLNDATYASLSMSALKEAFTMNEILYLYLPSMLNMLQLVVMIVCGCISNRCYYKHCVKKIGEIKVENEGAGLNEALEGMGGVNLPIGICVTVIYVAIIYLPLFL